MTLIHVELAVMVLLKVVSGAMVMVLLRVVVVEAVMEVLMLRVPLSLGATWLRFCNHCQKAGHIEIHCYAFHLELRPTFTTYAEAEDSFLQNPPDSTNMRNMGDSVTLTRAEYDALVRSQQVIGPLAPTATLAQISKGSED